MTVTKEKSKCKLGLMGVQKVRWDRGSTEPAGEKMEVVGDWRKMHSEELHNLYSSPSIMTMIKSKSMRCAGHVAGMGRIGVHIAYWW
jgi:hypothetical protein